MIFRWRQVVVFFLAVLAVGWLLYPSEYFRGQMHREEGDRSRAIAFFNDYLERHPYHKGATMALAAAYEGAGRPEEGIPLLLDFYRHRRGDYEAGDAVISLMERCARPSEAADFRWEFIADLRQRPHPDRKLVEGMLYEAYQRAAAMQDDERTLRALSALASLGGKDSSYRDQVLRLFLARGQFDKALAMLRDDAAKDPKDPERRRALARMMHLRHVDAGAIAVLDAALADIPGNIDLVGDRASLYVDAKRWKEAEGDLKTLMARRPKEEAYPNELARLYLESGRIEEGAKVLEGLIALKPADDKRWWALVYAYSDKGWHGDAAGVIKRMRRNWPEDMKLFDTLVYELEAADRSEEAAGLLRARLAAAPKDHARRRHLAPLLVELEHWEEAASQYKVLADAFPHEPDFWKNLVYMQESHGSKRDAIASLRRYLELYPDDMKAVDDLASLLSSTGDRKGAIEVLMASFDLIDPPATEAERR